VNLVREGSSFAKGVIMRSAESLGRTKLTTHIREGLERLFKPTFLIYQSKIKGWELDPPLLYQTVRTPDSVLMTWKVPHNPHAKVIR
jgi:hypothetical protein